jgi:glutamine synthetase
VAAKHGLRATFAPRIYLTSAGSSAHTHISVHSPTAPPKPTEGLSSLESSFLAGVLDHLQAMPAITLPIPASYKRMADGAWSGGTYVCWGTENRESPIRLANATSPASRNFEMRFVDGTANPYLVLAVILAAGHNGIRTQQQLTIKDCPGPLSAAQMEKRQRNELGITRRMPLKWSEARGNLERNKFFDAVLGTNFVTKYLSVNEVCGTRCCSCTP